MLMFLKEWSDTVPTIKLDGLVLSIESVCNSSGCQSVSNKFNCTVSYTIYQLMTDTTDTKEPASSSSQFPLMFIPVIPIACNIIVTTALYIENETIKVCLFS